MIITKEELEQINLDLIFAMNCTRKAVEGLIRKVPFSVVKLKRQAVLGF